MGKRVTDREAIEKLKLGRKRCTEKAKLEQEGRTCSYCKLQGYSPCKGKLPHTEWCRGEHIVNIQGSYYCYPCANKEFTS